MRSAQRAAVVGILIAAPVAKGMQLWRWADPEGTVGRSSIRQVALLTIVGGVAVWITRKPRLSPEPPPAPRGRAIAWLLGPIAVSGAIVAVMLIAGARSHTDRLEIFQLVFITALGEELLFRGLFAAMAARVFQRRGADLAVAASFAAWHVGNELLQSRSSWVTETLAVAGTVLVTAGGSLVFTYIKRRSGTLAGSWLAHIASNLPGVVFGS